MAAANRAGAPGLSRKRRPSGTRRGAAHQPRSSGEEMLF